MFLVEEERVMIPQLFRVDTEEQPLTLQARLGHQPTGRGQDAS